ncbi:MAG: YgiQ family radical SAM protein [Desulfosalsimonas sp.]
MNRKDFLPTTQKDINDRKWDRPDFILVTGDAYVDHPSFGAAVIARVLEAEGYRIAVLAQPDYNDKEAFQIFGRPRLAFLVTGGNLDSMVSNYTVNLKFRKYDVYSPGGAGGARPDRATLVYTSAIRRAFKKIPVILGGMEASLRRLSHFDYWSNKVRRSILVDSKADMIVYGMGEKTILEIARRMDAGEPLSEITDNRGTVVKVKGLSQDFNGFVLPDFQTLKLDPAAFTESFRMQERNTDPINARCLAEHHFDSYVVQNVPQAPLSRAELDRVHELPFTRRAHPDYDRAGKIPAVEEISFSIISSRGCFGGCNFCALAFHQGRIVRSRSHASILKEAKSFLDDPDFKGYIHDVGGPTANFRHPACKKQLKEGACSDRKCMTPYLCPSMGVDHSDYLSLLRKLRRLEGVKKVFVRSGIRYDYLLADTDDTFFHELVKHHISGQLKVAPEHVSDRVLTHMGKPSFSLYRKFTEKYFNLNRRHGKKQYLVPYFISSHPGATLADAVEVAEYLKEIGFTPNQVQDFYPTPGTLSTCMYYTEMDPETGEKIHAAKHPKERAMQRALLQSNRPENQALVREALVKAGRKDLIGYFPKCLIKPLSDRRYSDNRRRYEEKEMAESGDCKRRKGKHPAFKKISGRGGKKKGNGR